MNLVIENVEKVSKEQMGEIMELVQTMKTTGRPTNDHDVQWDGEHGTYDLVIVADEYEVAQVHVEVK